MKNFATKKTAATLQEKELLTLNELAKIKGGDNEAKNFPTPE